MPPTARPPARTPTRAIGTREAATCPEFSKVGTLILDSSALPAPIPGASTWATRSPATATGSSSPPTASAPTSSSPGSVHPDPQTGQLTSPSRTCRSRPDRVQHALLRLRARSAGDADAVRDLSGRSEFVPWDAALPDQHSTQPFTIDIRPERQPCPDGQRPFSPRFEAGTLDNTAGAHSPLDARSQPRRRRPEPRTARRRRRRPGFSRRLQGHPLLPGLGARRAMTARLPGLAELATPSCPAASQIGTAVAGAGAGTHPLYLPGKVYLAGPYKGAPLSLAVVTPAVSGPYDLGNVVVRAAINVDPVTAQVTAFSDPLPQIIGGIPLRAASVRVNLDRPDFILNPTNCAPSSRRRQRSAGAKAPPRACSQPFQVANCADLPYAPNSVSGSPAASTPRTPGDSRGARTRSTAKRTPAAPWSRLPKGELLDNAHIEHRLHARPVRRRRLPARFGDRGGTCQDAAPRQPAQRQRLPAVVPATNCPTWSSTSRAVRLRARRPHRHHQRRVAADDLRKPARRSRVGVRTEPLRRQARHRHQQQEPLREAERGHGEDGRPERSPGDAQAEAQGLLRIKRKAQAPARREGGALGDGQGHERPNTDHEDQHR